MGIAKMLPENIVNTRFEDLPPEAVYWCKVALMDTLGCALAGSREDAPVLLRETTMPVAGAAKVNESWGQPFEVVKPGASYKQYPCCYSTHAAIEAALTLTREHGTFDPAKIAKVDTWTPAFGLSYTNRPQPRSDLDAKFSVQYCVTRALTTGKVVLNYFENNAYKNPVPQAVLPRVRSETFTGKTFDPDDPFDAEPKLTLNDGSVLRSKVDRPLGRTSDIPIPHEHLRAKFADCAGLVLKPNAVAKALEVIDFSEKSGSVPNLARTLEAT